MRDGWIGLAWLTVSWYLVAVHYAGWVDWAGLVNSVLVSSGSPLCGMGVLACVMVSKIDCIGVNMIPS